MKRIGTEGDPKTSLTAVVAIVGTLILVLIIVGLQALFYHVENDAYAQVYSEPNLDLKMVRAQQLELLNSYGWIDREKGVVRVPIDRAMEMVVADPNAAVGAAIPAGAGTAGSP
ncbi:MAG: hypothetical protein MUC67_12400 [Acidobacteria bacterium]|jgi:hypothetical protein|nr:hypothetical protein [Acidobacteriota bacterium]